MLRHFHKQPEFQQWLRLALEEDIGTGDITSQLLLEPEMQAELVFSNRETIIVAGMFLIEEVLQLLGQPYKVHYAVHEGERLAASQIIATVKGQAQALLSAERLMLNLLQRCASVATLTAEYVDAVAGTEVMILDTRKTMPGMRLLDKYSVTCGGGFNHRLRLDDRILIKDNHIAVCGGISYALAKAKTGNHERLIIEIECDTLEQVKEAADLGVDWILLDNMPVEQLKAAVDIVNGRTKLEASGGITLQTIKAVAKTGVNAISVGALTHSAKTVDIGLDISLSPILAGAL